MEKPSRFFDRNYKIEIKKVLPTKRDKKRCFTAKRYQNRSNKTKVVYRKIAIGDVLMQKLLITIPNGPIKDSFVPQEVREHLENLFDVTYNEGTENYSETELRQKLKGKDAVLTGWGTPKISEKILAGNETLKIIAHTGGSVAAIVDDYAYEKGIKVLSGNEIYAESVAEACVAYALCALRRIPDYIASTREGEWREENTLWEGLLGQSIGLVSYGMITRHFVRMLQPFSPKIKVYSAHLSEEVLQENHMEKATLQEIFSTCKIISLHSALTERTYHMIDKALLQRIPDGAVLINTARGGVIDEDALIQELKKGRFRAVLDVYEQEPLPQDHPFRCLPNVYPLPHMGGPTYDRRRVVTECLADDIVRIANGETPKMEISQSYAAHMTK